MLIPTCFVLRKKLDLFCFKKTKANTMLIHLGTMSKWYSLMCLFQFSLLLEICFIVFQDTIFRYKFVPTERNRAGRGQ